MKNRKLIGVIISEVEGLYQHKLLKGIISECYALDYDIAIFSTFIKNSGFREYKIGEKNIFNLINFKHFDGILVAAQTLAIENLSEEIEDMLGEKCKCPILYIDEASKYFPSVYTNDYDSAEQIVDHLIEHHGYRDIFCLAANPNSIVAKNRVEGYKASLRKHNLPVDESRISYQGNFSYFAGEMLAIKIASGEIKKPDAIMCINDYMAIGLTNELINYGIHVPEDIAVTGYDAVDESATCLIPITTFSPPIEQTGREAVCELTRLMIGTRPEVSKREAGSIVLGQSCGCTGVNINRSGILRLKDKLDNYTRFLDSFMMETLTSTTHFADFISTFYHYLYLIEGYSDFFLCLCDKWDASQDDYNLGRAEYKNNGYTDEMILALASENRKLLECNTRFKSEDMIPNLWVSREKPKAYYFTPLHFNDYCIGYSVLSYGDKIKAYDITYRNWSRNIMNSLEYYRVHKQLYRASSRDILTGVYNRGGMKQKLPNILDDAIKNHKKLLVLMADMDNMKEINDTYGHIEGDNTIITVSKVIQSCLIGNEICARIGGDEFLVIGTFDETISSPEDLINRINAQIEHYNKHSNKPYEVKVSMGVYSDYITKDTNIDALIDRADYIMYENKAMNKLKSDQSNDDDFPR